MRRALTKGFVSLSLAGTIFACCAGTAGATSLVGTIGNVIGDHISFKVNAYKGEASTPIYLLPESEYQITAQGDYSVYASSLWNNPAGSYWATCGTPAASPMFPSPGITNGAVGEDAEFDFAGVAPDFGCGNYQPPVHQGELQVNTGCGILIIQLGTCAFQTMVPDGGAPTVPSPTHTYTYTVDTGLTLEPAEFRINDISYPDDYGELKLTVTYEGTLGIPPLVTVNPSS